MTIIIGLKCRECIVLASDSQTTMGNAKRLDAEKIGVIEFGTTKALVAQAGCVTTSLRAVEILTGLAKGATISDYRAVADTAQKAMRQVKEELRNQQCDCSMEELREFVLEYGIGCELMIAYYYGDGAERKAYIFTIDLLMGMATQEMSHFGAIGCGANVATLILSSNYTNARVDGTQALLTAIYTIEKVKLVDAYCAGDTKAGILSDTGKLIIPTQYKIKSIVSELNGFDAEMAIQRTLEFDSILEKLTKKWEEENEAAIYGE